MIKERYSKERKGWGRWQAPVTLEESAFFEFQIYLSFMIISLVGKLGLEDKENM